MKKKKLKQHLAVNQHDNMVLHNRVEMMGKQVEMMGKVIEHLAGQNSMLKAALKATANAV